VKRGGISGKKREDLLELRREKLRLEKARKLLEREM
jgi:hypothetical protein